MAVYQLDDLTPHMADSAWVADNAQVMGEVEMAAHSSVWFSAVVRGDSAKITIGEGSNVQDGSVYLDAHELAGGEVERLTVDHLEAHRADGGLLGEHHGVGAVVDRVGDVGHLGPGRAPRGRGHPRRAAPPRSAARSRPQRL